MTALYIALITAAVIMIILYIPIDCVIDFSYNDTENRGNIIIKYAFLTFKILPAAKAAEEAASDAEKDIKKDEPEKDKKDPLGTLKFLKTVYSELKEEILSLLNHLMKKTIRIKELNISAVYGTGDPMYTGIAAGAANAAVYNAVSVIDRHITLDKWNVSLDADFDNAVFRAGAYCKIRTRILYILSFGIRAAFLLLKIQKISRRNNKNG